MSQRDKFTPLRHALRVRDWKAADGETYDLLFNYVYQFYCQQHGSSCWDKLESAYLNKIRSEWAENGKKLYAHIHDRKRMILTAIFDHESAKPLWDEIPDAIKYWHKWGYFLKAIPPEDLQVIDLLWIKNSGEKFGFSIQRRIFLECGGTIECGGKIINDEDPRRYTKPIDLMKFQRRVGWQRIPFSGKDYPCFNYQDALPGHLPLISIHNPFLSSIVPVADFQENDHSYQTPLCQYYCWPILAHSAFNV
ncbi:GUN4 domain-containing protein [Nodularia sp. UHCC 0506]|uniref:GUN4 domain-containing protein n=1 Tax=Nodularia sp. UHCC 0506 TaxID=3110243 RepID=UPI002B204A1F|nr:GUN4 domain-containing protein [Nodularia sp. UHCC 0506]MEA5515176.1 GUN4 domain-containing protein [Nodularia sp. UHCC 0506]